METISTDLGGGDMDYRFESQRRFWGDRPGDLVRADRAALYLRGKGERLVQRLRKLSTKSVGERQWDITRYGREAAELLSMTNRRDLVEVALELTRNTNSRTLRLLAIKSIESFLDLLSSDSSFQSSDVSELTEKIEELEDKLGSMDSEKKPTTALDNSRAVFVIMPFKSEFNDVWRGAIERASADLSLHPIRVDTIQRSSNITDDIIESIKKCKTVIVDVTGNNPNVMYELGFAMALGKQYVIVSQSTEFLPFDIRNIRTIVYANTWSGIEELRQRLKEFLTEIAPKSASASSKTKKKK